MQDMTAILNAQDCSAWFWAFYNLNTEYEIHALWTASYSLPWEAQPTHVIRN